MWYSSLVLSVFAILLSSSQAFIFNALNRPTLKPKSSGDYRRYLSMIMAHADLESIQSDRQSPRLDELSHAIPRWIMVFTWQAPMMFMAYAVTLFLIGLTFYVCTPLFNGEVTTQGGKVRLKRTTMKLRLSLLRRYQSSTSQFLGSRVPFLSTARSMLTDISISIRS